MGADVGQLVVKNIEDDLVNALEQRAVRNGRSTEDETRAILRDALQREAVPPEPSQEHDAIDALYEELARLVAKRHPEHEDLALERRVSETLHQLRALQETAAQAMRERLERRMSMPIDAGRRALDEIKGFLERARDEDRTS